VAQICHGNHPLTSDALLRWQPFELWEVLYSLMFVVVPSPVVVDGVPQADRLPGQFLEDVRSLYASEGWEFRSFYQIGIDPLPEEYAWSFGPERRQERCYIVRFRGCSSDRAPSNSPRNLNILRVGTNSFPLNA